MPSIVSDRSAPKQLTDDAILPDYFHRRTGAAAGDSVRKRSLMGHGRRGDSNPISYLSRMRTFYVVSNIITRIPDQTR